MTKTEREEHEYKSLFTDERYAKKAWKALIGQSLQSDAADLPEFVDAKGVVAPQSIMYKVAYNNVEERLKSKGMNRKPMKAEVLVECNVIRGAFDNQVFTTLLERTAGKVKEELNVITGQFEELSDEELTKLKEMRDAKQLENKSGDDDDNGQ